MVNVSTVMVFLLLVHLADALYADPPRFVDVTALSGIDFRHVHGGTGKKYFVETMGSGCAFFDYNGDGRLDLFAVNGGVLPGYTGARPFNRLYRNDGRAVGQSGESTEGGWTFSDVTRSAGIGVTAYGMGSCVGDYDNDGYDDLYVSCYGPNSLFHNNGDGTFTEVARRAGVSEDSAWSVGCAFLDYDNDGYLDLYVGNYVTYSLTSFFALFRAYSPSFTTDSADNALFYPHPDNFKGVSDRLYRNNGDGTFTDVTDRAGVFDPSGKAMGLVCGDYDEDGDVDIFVANDMTPDFLYQNDGEGTFVDVGLLAGVAYSGEGDRQSSMGADFGDYDGDGRMDLVVTHFQLEGAVLYRNEGNGFFTDVTSVSRIKGATLNYVHWGVHFMDYDNDGWRDLFVATGHVLDNAELVGSTHAQPDLLFRNDGKGRFVDVTREVGDDLSTPCASRGAAFGDYDNDGDMDVFVLTMNGPARLLRNEDGNQNHWLSVKLVGGAEAVQSPESKVQSPEVLGRGRGDSELVLSNRNGIGARVTVWVGGRQQVREVRSGSSYLSQNDFRLHFGLGSAVKADSVVVRWPGGTVDWLQDVAADRQVIVHEGETHP